MADKYASWVALLAENQEEVAFRLHLVVRNGAPWLIAAPHGGGIEQGTTEIARAIAGQDLTFYSVEGIKPGGNVDLHITSHRFDEPKLIKAAPFHEKVLGIHGCDDGRRAGVQVWVGGGDHQSAKNAVLHFQAAGYCSCLDEITPGTEAGNLCNRGKSVGLQFELPKAFRARFFDDLTRVGRQRPKAELAQFVNVVRQLLGAL